MYTQVSFLIYTNLAYHRFTNLFVSGAVMDRINKDSSWFFVKSSARSTTSYSTSPRFSVEFFGIG